MRPGSPTGWLDPATYAIAWVVKRGAVSINPFAALPIVKSVARRERVLSGAELAKIWRAVGLREPRRQRARKKQIAIKFKKFPAHR
jgi:hypothetical protein